METPLLLKIGAASLRACAAQGKEKGRSCLRPLRLVK
jgi:hypothetical protein